MIVVAIIVIEGIDSVINRMPDVVVGDVCLKPFAVFVGEGSGVLPFRLKNAFIYYLAFLLLSAYDDTKATQMYTIALQQLGVSQTSK